MLPHTSMDQYKSIGDSSRMKHASDFNVEDGDKSIWHRFRWIETRDEAGNWSNFFAAKIWA